MRALGCGVAIAATIAITAGASVRAQPADDVWLLVADQGAGRVVTVAPDGSTEPVSDDGPTLAAARGLSLHPDGETIAVVDGGSGPETGAVWVLGADGTSALVADGINFPEGVTWLDASTLIVTSFTDQTVLRVEATGGTAEVVATLPEQPTGVIPFEAFDRSGVLVTTWQGPIVLVDPATGEVAPVTANLLGGGFPATLGALGACVPEFDADRVRCFGLTGQVTAEFGPFAGPVAVTAAGSDLVVTGEGGVARIDTTTGDVTPLPTDLANPAGVITLGGEPGPWAPQLPVVVETTAAPTTTLAATTPAAADTTPAAVETAPAEEGSVEVADDPAEVADDPSEVADDPAEVADDPAEVADDPSEVADPAAPAPEPAPAGDGGGFPWWVLIVLVGLAAVAAVVWLLTRKPKPETPPPRKPLRPHELPDEVKQALVAGAACDEEEFWKWYWRAEERVLWLQELMRNAGDLGDRKLFEESEREQKAILDALRDAPALLKECGRREQEGEPETGFSVDPIPVPCAGLAATEIAREQKLERLAAADERVGARLAELDDEQTAARHATEEAERDGERAGAELAERERELAANRKAALASDAEMAEEYRRRQADEIERRRAEMESANRRHQEFLESNRRSTAGTPESEATKRHMLESQQRYWEARKAYYEALPPGPAGVKEMARRARADLRDEAAGAQGVRDAVDAERWDAERREERARERFAELEGERQELTEQLAEHQAQRDELDRQLEEAKRRCEQARKEEEERRRQRIAAASAPPEGAPRVVPRRYFMHIYVDTRGLPHVGIGLRGPGFDKVFSLAGTRDSIGGYPENAWTPVADGGSGRALEPSEFTNDWYRRKSAADGQPYYELPVEITEEQFIECRRRLLAWARSKPKATLAPVPGGGTATMCPAVWLVVRSVFTSMANYGSTWFGGYSVLDEVLMIFYPEIYGRRPTLFGWDRWMEMHEDSWIHW